MIQSKLKPIELKAPESAKTPAASESNLLSKSNSAVKNEFKKELSSAKKESPKQEISKKESKKEESVESSTEPQVKKVEVSSDKALRKPSSLINEAEGTTNSETTSPKFFDPELTKDVQNLINPKTVESAEGVSPEELLKNMEAAELKQIGALETNAEVAELSPELTQALLKTPQVPVEGAEVGRSPALDLAQSEIDPQLLNNEDFVAQKNMVQKKALPNQGAYGMKNPAANKLAMEADLKSTQVVKDISMLENTNAGTGSSVNSQQFILNTLAEQNSDKSAAVGSAAAVKTFDMSQIKTADSSKIMDAISDYIVQAKASKEPTVSMRMNHQELGMIDITVAKAGVVNSDAVAISIGAHSAEGKNFFSQNSKELFSHLTSAGVNVADMKVETAQNNSKSDFDMGQQNQKHASSGERQFGSEQNQRRHEQSRREDLWKMFNKEAA